MENSRNVFIGYTKDSKKTKSFDNTYHVGTICHILQVLKLPDNSIRILVEGTDKAYLKKVTFDKFYTATIKRIKTAVDQTPELEALTSAVKKTFKEYTAVHGKIPEEVISTIERSDLPEKLIGNICFVAPLPMVMKMNFLLQDNPHQNLENLAVALKSEIEIMNIQTSIQGKVKKRMERTQKEYFLNEQIKELNRELGKDDDANGADEFKTKINGFNICEKDKTKLLKDTDRLAKLQPLSPEAGILRTYLETVTDLPWNTITEDNLSVTHAETILNDEHYNMKKAKERILDFIAVRQLEKEKKSPVLCLVGPPGTGKTSLGKSVATSLGREFARISLGGVRDEGEIRGHRKTYIGALPGKIIQAVKKAGVKNPVILLDEIDKVASDYKGDPAAALLEVLDPEQNHTFTDHYLEIPFDLSDVLFISTANKLDTVPRPLLDRMDIIGIEGYTEIDKIQIAQKFIIPKQLKSLGMSPEKVIFDDDAVQRIIRKFTMESGVRGLNRNISSAIRKLARNTIENFENGPAGRDMHFSSSLHKKPSWAQRILPASSIDVTTLSYTITRDSITKLLGEDKIPDEDKIDSHIPGLAVGLSYSQTGGAVAPIEVALSRGSGKLILTGKLGDVMKESAQIALSYIKSNCDIYGIDEDFDKEKDIHLHVPEGAMPKDGPSAGITITSAMISAIKKIPLIKGAAMTGEITLTGQLWPIGGLKEKSMAAARNNSKRIILSEKNRRDLKDIPQEVKDVLDFEFYTTVKDAVYSLFPEGTFPV